MTDGRIPLRHVSGTRHTSGERSGMSARCVIAVAALVITVLAPGFSAVAAEDDADDLPIERVLDSIDRAKTFLLKTQDPDGSWPDNDGYAIGVTSLATLALLNSEMSPSDPAVAKALKWLRARPANEPGRTYEIGLMIMALSAARERDRDRIRIAQLAGRLEQFQIRNGPMTGCWGYGPHGGGDRSNGQYAVLGLREAALAGAPISQETWARARAHWMVYQTSDGGWGYSGPGSPTGSMTVAGIATMVITEAMLRDENEVDRNGTIKCCGDDEDDQRLERAVQWMGRHFAVGHNPGANNWLLYYLYGMERAGRLSGRRFFGKHDWYREGAKFLIDGQSQRDGSWRGRGGSERNPVLATSFSLLFLSKGLSPVLMNKLRFPTVGTVEARAVRGGKAVVRPGWNRHPLDAHNLTELISTLPHWPKLVTWQVIDIEKLDGDSGVEQLLQAPVLYMAADEAPAFTEAQVRMLRRYIDNGGFIFAVNNCNSGGFHDGISELVRQMFPEGVASLQKLPADHPVFRAEYLLDPEGLELYGVDFGCRTSLIYCPEDLSCLWEKWLKYDPPSGRFGNAATAPRQLAAVKLSIGRANRIGVNVLAYATGREPPKKLVRHEVLPEESAADPIERGLLQIAKLRHDGGWNTAASAARNLLVGLNRAAGVTASPRVRDLTAGDSNIFKYPLVYMHGRREFTLTAAEREQLRKYLTFGNVLFADACCSAEGFDRSFRELIGQMFPGRKLVRIPPDHELFTSRIGYDVRRVRRRVGLSGGNRVEVGEPYLEGLEIDGRLAVIYSKYDISCALEQQASLVCAGYVHEDALKLAVNAVLYALLQDVRPREEK